MRQEIEFLPAALEIQEKPLSPAGRAIAIAIMVFFVLALVWAYTGEIDIVATAQGKIIPSGRVKIVQPFEIGVVSKYQDTWVGHQSSGDSDSLALPSRQIRAPFFDYGVVALRQFQDKLVRASQFRGLDQ